MFAYTHFSLFFNYRPLSFCHGLINTQKRNRFSIFFKNLDVKFKRMYIKEQSSHISKYWHFIIAYIPFFRVYKNFARFSLLLYGATELSFRCMLRVTFVFLTLRERNKLVDKEFDSSCSSFSCYWSFCLYFNFIVTGLRN